jgi:hypothetical protein
MNKRSQDKIIRNLAEVESAGIFSFAARTTKNSLKKSRKTGEPTPANLLQITVYTAATVSMGNDYEALVNRKLVAQGDKPDFEAGGTYCSPFTKNRLVYKHNERDDFYLRVYPNACHSFNTKIVRKDADGNVISDSEWKEIEAEYFPLKKPSDNQGLDEELRVNNYKLENVLWVKRKDVVIDRMDLDAIDALFSEQEEI